MAFELEQKHSLTVEDARARIAALGEYLQNKHGLTVRWTGDDTAVISGKYLVVTIEGSVVVESGKVRFSGKDPGMLWRGKARDYLSHKLGKYLDAGVALEALPRR
ncbi:MAG: polyhydroxyalkanoic acid system family protein [Polyangiaceae bacterium]|nr:polyhydroxyalkanoic acid system family protein [Polyangiaceae bacterium]